MSSFKKKKFFDDLNFAYTKLKADPELWEEELHEREEWDQALKDGLDKDLVF